MDPRQLDITADRLDREASDKRDQSDELLREAEALDAEASDTRAEAARLRAEEARAIAQERDAESKLPPPRPWPF